MYGTVYSPACAGDQPRALHGAALAFATQLAVSWSTLCIRAHPVMLPLRISDPGGPNSSRRPHHRLRHPLLHCCFLRMASMSSRLLPPVSALVGLLMIELLVLLRYQPPSVPPADTLSTQQFDGNAALQIHRRVFDDTTHPIESAANRAVRDRLVELLESHGWQVEVQQGAVSSRREGEVLVQNVVAHRAEQSGMTARPLVLASHYDSCVFGPGAGDAGMCVAAIVEAARQLTTDVDRLKRPMWLLFTDGEEAGLLGAQLFVRDHPVSAQHPYVLNFDARGNAGPVVMYETHAGNDSAVCAWISQLAAPVVTGSEFTAVYRSMPNGTDFSVFADAGWRGFNFAVIDGAEHYHQPDDTFASLDPRSVQHFGQHALSMARLIAGTNTDLPDSPDNAVFFDLLGITVFHYPVRFCLPLAVGLVTVAAVTSGRRIRWRTQWSQVLWVWLWMAGSLLVAAMTGWVVSRSIAGTVLLPRPFVAHGHWISAATYGLTVAVTVGIGAFTMPRVDQRVVSSAFWLGQALATVAVSAVAPEFSHLFFVPACIAFVLFAVVRDLRPHAQLTTLAAGVMLIPVLHLLSIALGPGAALLLSPVAALIALPLMPLFGRRPEQAQAEWQLAGAAPE